VWRPQAEPSKFPGYAKAPFGQPRRGLCSASYTATLNNIGISEPTETVSRDSGNPDLVTNAGYAILEESVGDIAMSDTISQPAGVVFSSRLEGRL